MHRPPCSLANFFSCWSSFGLLSKFPSYFRVNLWEERHRAGRTDSNHVIVLGVWIMQLTSIIYIILLLIKRCGLAYTGSLKTDKGNGNSSNRSPCVTIYHHNTNSITYLANKRIGRCFGVVFAKSISRYTETK